jgi:hypothetical protein
MGLHIIVVIELVDLGVLRLPVPPREGSIPRLGARSGLSVSNKCLL